MVASIRPWVHRADARRISCQQPLAFERLHEAAYREHGFELVDVAPAPPAERAALIVGFIASRP